MHNGKNQDSWKVVRTGQHEDLVVAQPTCKKIKHTTEKQQMMHKQSKGDLVYPMTESQAECEQSILQAVRRKFTIYAGQWLLED